MATTGVRSPLAQWMGGAASTKAVISTGPRSLLAPWMGGAATTSGAPKQVGRRSMLAGWMGGASGAAYVPPPAPAPIFNNASGGGAFAGRTRYTSAHEPRYEVPIIEHDERDEEEIIIAILCRVAEMEYFQ